MKVDPSTIAKVLGTVEQLSTRGANLADSTVPRFFNGPELDALAREASSISSVARDATQLLGEEPLELLLKDRLASVKQAADHVAFDSHERWPLADLQRAGRTIHDTMRSTIGDVRATVVNDTERVLVDVRAVQPRALGTEAVDDLRAAIELREALELPKLMVGSRPLYRFDVPAGDPAAHVRLLHRPYLQQQGLMGDVDVAAARIDELIGTDPARISPVDAAELRVLLETGPDATWTLPRSVGDKPLGEVLDTLSRGTDDQLLGRFAAAVTEHRATIDAAVPAPQPGVGLRTLLDRGPSTWTGNDWRELATILERDAAAGSPLNVPRTVSGARSVERIIRDGIRGREGAAAAMQRYVAAWDTIVPRLDPDAAAAAIPEDPRARRLIGELATIVTRDADELTGGDWLRFRTLLDADPTGEILRGPRELRNTSSLHRLLRTDTGAGAVASLERRRYLEAWRTTIGPGAITDDVRRQETHAMLLREPESLTTDEWHRLGALVDGAQPSLVGELQLAPDVADLGAIALRHANGSRAVDGHTRYAFAAASLAIDELTADTVRLHGAMRELADRAPGELGPNDWARIRALLDADTSGTVLDGPRMLTAAPKAEIIATSMMNGRDDMVLPARRLLAAWSAHMSGRWSSPEQLTESARRYATREPSTLAPAEWRELGTMIDIGASTLRAPRNVPGIDPLEVTAARAAEGMPIALPQAERAFRAWRLQFDAELQEPGALTAAARTLVDRDPATLSVDEWRRLQSIVDFDAGWNMLGFPGMPKDAKSLATLTELGLERRTIRTEDWNRIVTAWRLHADGIAADQPKLEAALSDALSPASGSFDDAGISTLRAILDADSRGRILSTGRGGELVDQLRELVASSGSTSIRPSVESRVVDQLRNRLLDAPFVTERRAAIRAGIDGATFPPKASLDEIREADPHWAERTSFDQLVLEARLGAFSGDKAFTSARDFLHRARDVEMPANLPDSMRALWGETRTLIDVNLERLAGRTPRGQVKGYSTHPDYAQVGRIQSNVELMHRVVRTMLPATPPDQQVRHLGEAASAAATRAAATENLAW